jgi:hypothetical protein
MLRRADIRCGPNDADGPMLDVLKGFHGTTIEAPSRRLWRPDPDRLEVQFARFH